MQRKLAVVGVDEAGRGPLAGPVAVGAVLFKSKTGLSFKGLKDSKELSEQKREGWSAKMKEWQKEGKINFAVSLVSNSVIDEKGIVAAVSLGIKRCLKKLTVKPKKVFIMLDGALKAPEEFIYQKTITRGDEIISVISLASIAAKVTRDKRMKLLAKKYPKYGFEIHKGYGTLAHRKAIKKYGVSVIHRKSFLKSFDK